jgi:nucleoid-associated protein Lsr2
MPEGTCTVARREVVVLEDDLEGGTADETVKFALDGVQYEIDLTAKNAARLRESFSDFIAHGRRVGRGGVVVGGRAAARARGSAAADREQNKAIRAWAKRKGRNISDRGRIPQEIVDEYNADAGR